MLVFVPFGSLNEICIYAFIDGSDGGVFPFTPRKLNYLFVGFRLVYTHSARGPNLMELFLTLLPFCFHKQKPTKP